MCVFLEPRVILEDLFLKLDMMLQFNKSDRLEIIKKYFYVKSYDTIKYPSQTLLLKVSNYCNLMLNVELLIIIYTYMYMLI